MQTINSAGIIANLPLPCKLLSLLQTAFADKVCSCSTAWCWCLPITAHSPCLCFVEHEDCSEHNCILLRTTVRAYNITSLYILPWELQIILHLHPAPLCVSRGSAYCLNRVFYCTVSNFPGATLLLNNLQPRSAAEWRPGLHIWDTVTLTGDTVSLGRVASGAADD